MTTKTTNRTHRAYSRHNVCLKINKSVMSDINMSFADRKRRAEIVCGEPSIADGILIEYLDIPTFIRRGVALSG